MFTRNYYKLKKNNKLRSRVFYRRNSFDQNVVLISDVSFEQLRYPNGNYGTGTEYHYGYSDPLFTACDFLPKYNAEPISETTVFTIGFDGSNTPASIDDYKLIDPILNCTIISTVYSLINNTLVREFTIRNDNNTEIIINGVGIFACFGRSIEEPNSSTTTLNLPLCYREVFTSPITVPAKASFIYRLETTEGE